MNAAFEVQNILGSGLTENIYEESLCYEFGLREIKYERQVPVEIYYKDHLSGKYIIDLIVENKICLELKSVSALHNAHEAQIISYLKAKKLELGILINFGQASVESKRILNSDILNLSIDNE
jgi:GxxExxY protein